MIMWKERFMTRLKFALVSYVLLLPACLAAVQLESEQPGTTIAAHHLTPDEAQMRAHVAYLASDELRGRKPGTDGYDKAAAYVKQQMEKDGLRPAGDDGGWYQKVPLVATHSVGTPQMTIDGQPLAFDSGFAVWPTPGLAGADLDAPVVFAAYGVVDAATGRDDYRGLDVKGKIVALFVSGPKGVNDEVAANESWYLDRTKVAKAHGAVGVIYLHTKEWEHLLPFKFLAPIFASNQTTWEDNAGSPDLGAPRLGLLSSTGAAKLFEKSGTSWEQVRAAEDAGKPVHLGPLNVRLATHQKYATDHFFSMNVVGRLQGKDPQLARQTVVMTAHLDHVGTIPPVKGDEIANGAIDNAMGVATILEAARQFQVTGKQPKRSILFIALTAEESGLTGSDYFVHHSTVPASDIVANINTDAPVLTYRFQDLVALGAERTSIGTVAKSVIESEELKLTPVSMAQRAFTSSDHYSFVRIGVPVIVLSPGPKAGGREARTDYSLHRYHTPFDDMSQPFDWTAGREFVKIYYLLATALADAPNRPYWVKGDYFGALYKGPVAAH